MALNLQYLAVPLLLRKQIAMQMYVSQEQGANGTVPQFINVIYCEEKREGKNIKIMLAT